MQSLVIETRAKGRPVKQRQLENSSNHYESPCCPGTGMSSGSTGTAECTRGREKRAFSGKSKLMYFNQKDLPLPAKSEMQQSHLAPLSLLWDVCQNSPWHLPIVAAQSRMDVAGPAPSPSSGHSAGSWRSHRAAQVPRGLCSTESAPCCCKRNSP